MTDTPDDLVAQVLSLADVFSGRAYNADPWAISTEPTAELLRTVAKHIEALECRVHSVRAAALEEAAAIAETWFDHHRPQQPKKSRFNIYDIEHWAKSATRLVAEDIRALAGDAG